MPVNNPSQICYNDYMDAHTVKIIYIKNHHVSGQATAVLQCSICLYTIETLIAQGQPVFDGGFWVYHAGLETAVHLYEYPLGLGKARATAK